MTHEISDATARAAKTALENEVGELERMIEGDDFDRRVDRLKREKKRHVRALEELEDILE